MLKIESDGDWRVSQAEADGWRNPEFDDSKWSAAKVLAPYGGGPWGAPSAGNDYEVPYAAGIPKQVRIIYLPKPGPVWVRQLEKHSHYTATHFDPVTGESHPLGPVQPDADGSWQSPDPASTHDWVLILETTKISPDANH
jgi:hypothetical protein